MSMATGQRETMAKYRARIVLEQHDGKRWRSRWAETIGNDKNRGNAEMFFYMALVGVGGNQPDWTPFEETVPQYDTAVPESMRELDPGEKMYMNSRMLVTIVPHESKEFGRYFHLSWKNLDRSARHDWREIQRMKNEIFGEDYEAFEIYPAEERLHDSCNQFHVWVLEKGVRIPMGFTERMVGDSPMGEVGSQRPWPEGEEPDDLLDLDEFLKAENFRVAFMGTPTDNASKEGE